MNLEADFEQFQRDRDALLSAPFSEAAMRAYMRKYSSPTLAGKPLEIIEAAYHKAVTGLKSLPLVHRQKSKRWLNEHGLHSLDDGDLTGGPT
jgi:hypothetical protein